MIKKIKDIDKKKVILDAKEFLKSFFDKDLTLYAASLSFYTIFTIIPLLLIMMTLLTSLPSFKIYYKKIQQYIFSNMMPVNSEIVMNQINSFLQNASQMSIIGFIMIIVASLLFFQNFEYIAGKIFNAKKRSLWDAITTYWTLITLTPIGMGFSFYITAYIAKMMASNSLTSGIDILPLVPYLITWFLFFVVFKISVNMKINTKAALLSSLFTSVAFNISKNGFVYYVILNKSYTTIYGSFSIVLFLFLWIYISWIIFIYGLKVCYILHKNFTKNVASNEEKNL